MTATIHPIGELKKYFDPQNPYANVESGISVREALLHLRVPVEVVALVLVNEESRSKDYIIQEDDAIKIIAVLGGG